MFRRHARPPLTPLSSLFFTFCLLLLVPLQAYAIKFNLIAQRYPAAKCIWNPAHTNTLVVVTANVLAGDFQKVDVEIMDSSPQKNVYMTKKNLNGESRLAITTHAEGEVGVCFKNTLDENAPDSKERSRVIDLDVDIGADAVDYNAIANQESLSAMEVEIMKLEGITKELVEEMDYLKRREERFAATNYSTNERVEKFGWFIIVALAGLGAWQILHLRSYFKRKYLID